MNLSLILQTVYILIAGYFFLKFLKWLAIYIKHLIAYTNIKGWKIIPVFGNLLQLTKKDEFLNEIMSMAKTFKNEPIFIFWRGWTPIIMFHKGDYFEILASSSKHTQKSPEYDFLHPWLGLGLLNSHGEKWAVRRRIITPTFHFEILSDFLNVMNEQTEILVNNLTELSKNENNTIDIFKRITLCALDIICESAMGQNVNAQNQEDSKYVAAVQKISEIVRARAFEPSQWNDFIFSLTKTGREHSNCLKILHGFTQKVIKERNEEFENSNLATQKRVAFLDMLLKSKNENNLMTFDDIQEEVDTFMFEGHDTTAAAASWACHLIGAHLDVQKKLHKEIDEIFGSSDRHVTNEDLKNLKYLECVIKETLRLFPSVPFFGRVFSEDEIIGDHQILKGTSAVVFSYMIHRDEKYYPDPEKFDPDRFLPENTRDRNPYAYIPFSAGKRNCVGQRFALMEEKVILVNILRKFEIKSLKTIEELKPIADVILKPQKDVPVRLNLRNNRF